MSRNYGGGKRQREAERDRRKRDKAERLRRSRMARPAVRSGADIGQSERLPPVALEDVVISVPSQSRRDTTGPARLFVGGLDFSTSLETLRSAFEPFGIIDDTFIVLDRMTGRSRGFAFVTFAAGAGRPGGDGWDERTRARWPRPAGEQRR